MHLTQRVAWHDNNWNGTVCRRPLENSYCMALDRIREERDDLQEDRAAGRKWDSPGLDELPPCQAEAGAFMSPHEWVRVQKHPYQKIDKARETHGHLVPQATENASVLHFCCSILVDESRTSKTNRANSPRPASSRRGTAIQLCLGFQSISARGTKRIVFRTIAGKQVACFFLHEKKGIHWETIFGD